MSEVELIAVGACPYRTGIRMNGERFTATQADAELLVSLGRAKLAKAVKAESEEPKQAYKTRDLKAKG